MYVNEYIGNIVSQRNTVSQWNSGKSISPEL